MSSENVPSQPNGHVYRFDDIRIDSRAERVWKDDRLLHLEPKGFQLLCFLIENRGGLIEKQRLLDAVWGDTFVTENAMTRLIAQLRKALGDEAKDARYIETVPKRGYRFVADVQEELPSGAPAPADVPATRRWWTFVAAGVLGTAAVAAGLWVNLRREEGGPPPTTTPLTSFPGIEEQPALSPDGKFLAYIRWGESGTRELYVQQIGGGEPLAIHTSARQVFAPAWSPDSLRIAFIGHVDAEDDAPTDGIFLVPALGGQERQIDVFRIPVHGISWSPTSELLAFPHRDSPDRASRITLLSLETGDTRALTSPPPEVALGDWGPRFSPNGETVAFFRGGQGGSDVHVVSVEGGEERRLTFSNANMQGLDWTSDGKSIVFSTGGSGRVGFWGLFRVSASGGEPEPLPVGEQGTSPTVARQGGRLAYVRRDADWNLWRASIPRPGSEAGSPQPERSARRSRVAEREALGVGPQRIKKSPEPLVVSSGLDYLPHYSPDGNTISFTSSRSGAVEVWLCDSDGSNPRRLTSFKAPVTISGWWSPDGKQIAFWSTKEGSKDIYVVSAAGGIPRRLTTETSDEADPTWSRDGRFLYFNSNRTGSEEIWKMRAEGGEPIQLTHHGGALAFESPDGASLYFAKQSPNGGDPGIWRMPISGGEEELVVDAVGFGHWTLTERGIYFVSGETRSGWPIELYDFATGKVSTVTVLEDSPLPFWISVSPDEQSILYVRSEATESDILLVENFR